MFDIHEQRNGRSIRLLAWGMAVLSVISMAVVIVINIDVGREQEIVAEIVKHLPESDMDDVAELSDDLWLHEWLGVLLVLNVVGTAIALALVVRGYLQSEQSLRDVKVLASDILACLDAAVITTDRSGNITSINVGAKKMIGLNEESVGQSLAQLAPDHALLQEVCAEVNANHQTVRDQDYCVTLQGHKQTLRTSCTILRNQRQDEIGTVVYIRDVTQRTLLEERVRRMERYMGLGTLAAGLQHEIKNPLSALSLHIQLLQERLDQEEPQEDVQEMLDILRTEVTRITQVLDGFRNYASVKELGRSQVDVIGLVEKLLRLLNPQAESQGIRLVKNITENSTGTVLADSVQLEQVLLNLALNGMAAMPKGGTLTFGVDSLEDAVRILVTDTGHGIPEDFHAQLFDPYFTTRNDGTGMGLALCDKIIRQHGGSIDFRTGDKFEGQPGTEFTVLLPREVHA